MEYDTLKEWNKFYQTSPMQWPTEYVIRIFKGSYPRLNLPKDYEGKKICDVGCGDGGNLVFLNQCRFKLHGVEITPEIVEKVRRNLSNFNISSDIRVGKNDTIPFEDGFFDYLLSWNACYYMGDKLNFEDVVKEFARVLKKDGYLVFSIPKKSSFIFKDSEPHSKKGYQIIRNDPFKIRNGEVFRIFKNEKEIEEAFSDYFKNFVFGSIHDDAFGYDYHWHIGVCQKK